jgi:adenine-specific DNA-methyltransferase
VGQWKTPKDGVEEVLAAGRSCWENSGHDAPAATAALKAWWRKNKSRFDSSLPVYDRIDETGRIYFGGPLGNTLLRPNLQYDLLHPVTGKPVRMPPNGWAHSQERMAANVAAGLIMFGPDHTTTATYKQYLEEFATQVPLPTFRRDRRSSTLHLQKVLGDKRFPFPKDHEVLMKWIRMLAPQDAVVLDFFGGSGTTTEAVIRLNAEDDGSRQSVLVTNNEVGVKQAQALRKSGVHPGDDEWEALGVFEYVTRPRISTVVTGKRPDGSAYSDGLPANVEFLKMNYLDPGMVRRGREFAAIAPLLWLEAGATGERITEQPGAGWALTDHYGVLFTVDAMAPFAAAVSEAAQAERAPRVVFIITDSPTEFQAAAERLPIGIDTVRLYESYLANYTINMLAGAR